MNSKTLIKTLIPVMAMAAIGSAEAKYCLLAEDTAVNLPDIVNFSMSGDGEEIAARIGLAASHGQNPDAFYSINFTDPTGGERFLRYLPPAQYQVESGTGLLGVTSEFMYGHYDGGYVYDGPATGSFNGDVLEISAPAAAFGFPRQLGEIEAVGGMYMGGTLTTESTAPVASWEVTVCDDFKSAAAAATTKAAMCSVVTDAANDSLPNSDITGVDIATDGSDLVVAISTFGGEFSGGAWFDVFLEYNNGEKWFVEADATANPIEAPLAYYGTWSGAYDLEYANDGDSFAPATIEDGQFVVRIPLAQIGSPSGEITVFAASQEPVFGGDAYSFGFTLDITDSGTYAIGDSCGKSADPAEQLGLKSGDTTSGSSAGGGSLGWLLIGFGLAGFARRRG